MSFVLLKGAGSRRGSLVIWLVIVTLGMISIAEISQLGINSTAGPLFRI